MWKKSGNCKTLSKCRWYYFTKAHTVVFVTSQKGDVRGNQRGLVWEPGEGAQAETGTNENSGRICEDA